MGKLRAQMLALRIETRSALNLLIDRVSAIRLLMPSARASGYEPLVNMDMDMDMDMDKRLDAEGSKVGAKPGSSNALYRRTGGRRQTNKTAVSTTPKPH
jgi:hypothetical protein